MERFHNKYRIPPARLQNWDYGWNASYFITICTKNRICYFGENIDGKLKLNEWGQKAAEIWSEIPKNFPDAVLDEFVIMPNHVHGIITIDKPDVGRYPGEMNGAVDFKGFVDFRRDAINPSQRDAINPKQRDADNLCRDAINRVSTQMNDKTGSDKQKGGITGINNPMFSENISKIIRWYKGRVSFEMRKALPGFRWQSRFHDHIIRDETSYQVIRKYILNNPPNWKKDDFYTAL